MSGPIPTPENLHIGKLSEEAKTTVPESMHQWLADRAHHARCTPSDLLRDCLYLVVTGATYSEHIANDRRAAMFNQGRRQGDKRATEETGAQGDAK